MPDLGVFRLSFEKAVIIFDIATLEFTEAQGFVQGQNS